MQQVAPQDPQPALPELSLEALAQAPVEVQQLAQPEALSKCKELLSQQAPKVFLFLFNSPTWNTHGTS
eukprot:5006819-Pyramimonas_sp.AAC.1